MVIRRLGGCMKLKKYSLFTIILLLILSFTTYSIEKTEVFNIDNEWNIFLPEDWQMEGRSPYQQYYSFYPNIPFYSMIKIYNYDIEEILKMIPAGRMGDPEEVAHAVNFLMDEKAGYITRQVIAVNGGLC